MTLGEIIRQIRVTKGYSQETMAEPLGLSVAGYGKLERGETEFTIVRLKQVASILKTDVKFILSVEDGSHKLDSWGGFLLTSTEATHTHSYAAERMSKLEQEVLLLKQVVAGLVKAN